MSNEWPSFLSKALDLMERHQWTVIPMTYIIAVISGVLLIYGRLSGGWWALALLCCLFSAFWAVLLPIRNMSENSRLDQRLRVVTSEEDDAIRSLIEREPSFSHYPHHPKVSGLLADGILKELPTTLDIYGMRTFGLTPRAKRRVLKAYGKGAI